MQSKLNKLEIEVLNHYLDSKGIEKEYFGKNFETIEVIERRIIGSGYMVEIKTDKSLEDRGVLNDRGGGDLEGVINNKIAVGFVVYVDDGMLNAIEGYTFEEVWPENISDYTITRNENKR